MFIRFLVSVAAVAAFFGARPARAHYTVYGLKADGSNTIAVFKSDEPGIFTKQVPVTGLLGGEKLAAISFDPRTGVLFGFGHSRGATDSANDDDTGRFYVINRVTGAASAISSQITGLGDSHYTNNNVDPSFAMHVKTVLGWNDNEIRVLTYDFDDIRLDLDSGEVTHDTFGDDLNEHVVASAYLVDECYYYNATSLYITIDTSDGDLELQDNDDGGWIANLFSPFDANRVHVGFDIDSRNFAGLVSYTDGNGITRLASMDLWPWWDDGDQPSLTQIGIIGDGNIPFTSLAILPGTGYIAVGRGSGKGTFKLVNPSVNEEIISIDAFGSGGCRVALGDTNGDGFPEVVAVPGPGPLATVKVYDGEELINSGIAVLIPEGFQPAPFGNSYKDGLFVGAGIAWSYCADDIVVGTGSGRAQFRIIVSESLLMSKKVTLNQANYAAGGARVCFGILPEVDESPLVAGVACGCVKPYVIVGSGTADTTSRVSIFDAAEVAATTEGDVPGFDVARMFFNVPGFTGPIFVAACDIDDSGDHFIVGRGTGSPTVKVIYSDDIDLVDADGLFPRKGQVQFVEASFQAFPGTQGGVRVGSAILDMLPPPYTPDYWYANFLGGTGSGPVNSVRGFPNSFGGFSALFTLTPFPASYTGGVFVAGCLGIRPYCD